MITQEHVDFINQYLDNSSQLSRPSYTIGGIAHSLIRIELSGESGYELIATGKLAYGVLNKISICLTDPLCSEFYIWIQAMLKDYDHLNEVLHKEKVDSAREFIEAGSDHDRASNILIGSLYRILDQGGEDTGNTLLVSGVKKNKVNNLFEVGGIIITDEGWSPGSVYLPLVGKMC